MCSLSPTRTRWLPLLLLFAAIMVGHTARALPLAPRSFYVQTTEDKVTGQGPLSLREAVIIATATPGASDIFLPAGTYALTIPRDAQGAPGTGELAFRAGTIRLFGSGVGTTVIQSGLDPTGRPINRLAHVYTGAGLAIRGLTLSAGAGAVINEGTLDADAVALIGNRGSGITNSGSLHLVHSLIAQNSNGLTNTGTAVVADTTFTDNSSWTGGAVDNEAPGTLQLVNVTLSGNHVSGGEAYGAGLANGQGATAQLVNCTLFGNRGEGAVCNGVGLWNQGTASLQNCLVAGNTLEGAATAGAGIWTGGTLRLRSSIVSDNYYLDDWFDPFPVRYLDVQGSVQDLGRNWIGPSVGDLRVGPLADNGGPVPTHLLLPGSPVLDAADTGSSPPADARGVPRPFPADGRADIGATEASPLPILALSGGVPAYLPGAGPVAVDSAARLRINDGVSLNGGELTASLGPDQGDGDELQLQGVSGLPGQIALRGALLYYGTVPIGSLSAGAPGTPLLRFSFNGAATAGAVRQLLRSVVFASVSASPGPGLRTVTWELKDGSGLSTGILASAVAVLPAAPAGVHPVAAPDSYSVPYAAPLTVSAPGVRQNDPGATAAVVLLHGAAHGTLQLSGDGSFTYRPQLDFSGEDTFQYALTDGLSLGAPATVTLTVQSRPGPSTPNVRVVAEGTLRAGQSNLRFRLRAVSDARGVPSGELMLSYPGPSPWYSSRQFSSLRVENGRLRIYGVGTINPYHRYHRSAFVLDLNPTPGAPDQVRLEFEYPPGYYPRTTVVGPWPFATGGMTVQTR